MKKLNKILKPVAIFGIVAVLMGCSHNPINDYVTIIGNKHYMDNVKVTEVQSIKDNGTFKAQASIQNTDGSESVQLYYRCVYYDANSFRLNDDGQWEAILIYTNQSQIVSCSTTDPDAVTFKIELSSGGKVESN